MRADNVSEQGVSMELTGYETVTPSLRTKGGPAHYLGFHPKNLVRSAIAFRISAAVSGRFSFSCGLYVDWTNH